LFFVLLAGEAVTVVKCRLFICSCLRATNGSSA